MSTRKKASQKKQGSKWKRKREKNGKVYQYSLAERRKYVEEKGGVVMTQIERVWDGILRLDSKEFNLADLAEFVKMKKSLVNSAAYALEKIGLLFSKGRGHMKYPKIYSIGEGKEKITPEEAKVEYNAYSTRIRKEKITSEDSDIISVKTDEPIKDVPLRIEDHIPGVVLESNMKPLIPETINVNININIKFLFGEK